MAEGFWAKHQQRQRKKQRGLDRILLFPAIREKQATTEQGDEAIRLHIEIDRAWSHPEEWQHEAIEK